MRSRNFYGKDEIFGCLAAIQHDCRVRLDYKAKLRVAGVERSVGWQIPSPAAIKMIVPVPCPFAERHQGNDDKNPNRACK